MQVSNPGGAVQVARVALTSAQIKALDVTPVTIIPAAGANRAILVLGGSFEAIFGTIAYVSISAPALQLTYNGIAFVATTGIVSITDGGSTALLTAAQSELCPLSGFSLYVSGGGPITLAPSVASNKPVTLIAPAGVGYNFGPIVSSTLGAGGLGYLANDTGVIDPSSLVSSGDATYKVLTVGGGGAVATYQVTGAGTAYPVANGIATGTGGAQPGVGTGFTVNATGITPGNGTLVVTLYYAIVSL